MAEFKVLQEIGITDSLQDAVNTIHNVSERNDRNTKINDILGQGTPVTAFIVDKGHPNGPEIHTILDNAVIVVQNFNTKRLICQLIARPGQLRRYWEGLGYDFPKELNKLMKIAQTNQINGRNNW